MARIAVFASGNGTNFVAIHDALSTTEHTVSYLVCNRPSAGVVRKAEERGVPVHIVRYAKRPRQDAEADIARILNENPVELIALAGYMKIFTPAFVHSRPEPIVNIHPSLLPKYPGTQAIERSWESGDEELGVTVHYVDQGVDSGPIVAQRSLNRDTLTDIAQAEELIHQIEHDLYPKVIVELLDRLDGLRTEQRSMR